MSNRVISLYSEATPNPETMKFVMNKMLFARNSVDFQSAEEVDGASPFAKELFGLPYTKGVFISNNFVTVAKKPGYEWNEIIPEIKEFIKAYLQEDRPIVNEEVVAERKGAEAEQIEFTGDEAEVVEKIKDILEKYVQPAVEMDGGSIVFKNYAAGKVTLGMQGACSGCPSSTVTLKNGIEGMMKRMIPEVQEVVADAM